MDVKTTFLNGEVEEDIYIQQPEGFSVHGNESHVCKMKKSLYGLKKASRYWYSRINIYVKRLGLSKSEANPNLYFKIVKN